jgi:hypothetical protein
MRRSESPVAVTLALGFVATAFGAALATSEPLD